MGRRTTGIIVCLAITSLTVGTDFTGALMLVTPIEREFGVDITTTQWVLNIYALTFAMGMVAGGRLGDMFGRRRLLLIGLAIFGLASLGCAAAPSIGWLIAARAVQGIGSALVWPSVLGLGSTAVVEQQRGSIMGLLIGSIALGNVIGPVVAGVLAGFGDWRMFFLINLALGVLSGLLVLRFVAAEAREKSEERVDYLGMVVLALALLALLYALDVGPTWGWSSLSIVALFATSAVLIVLFPILERHVADPLVPPTMLRNGQLLLAFLLNGLIVPALFLLFLYIPQYLHKVLGWSVLTASLGTLPLMGCLSFLSVTSGRLYGRMGPRRLLMIGYGVTSLGALSVILLQPAWEYAGILVPMILIGIGGGLVVGPAGSAAVGAAAPSRAGLAGALSFTVHLALGAAGVAAGTAILFATSAGKLASGLAGLNVVLTATEQATLNGGAPGGPAMTAILSRLPPEDSEKIARLVQAAFTDGLQRAYWLVLALAIMGFLATYFLNAKKLGHTTG